MSDVSAWSPLDESNTAPPPDGWPEFMLPSAVNNSARAMMGAVRRMYDKQVDGSLVLPYLKLSGGTVTGNVTVSGTLTAGGVSATTLYASSNINSGGTITATGAITTSLTVSAVGNIGTQGGLYANGEVNVGGRANADHYDIQGVRLLARGVGDATFFHDDSGITTFFLQSSGHNVHRNTQHDFYNRAATVLYASLGSSGITVYGAVNASGEVAGNTLRSIGAANIGGTATVGALTASGAVTGSYITSTGNINAASQYTGGSMNLGGEVRGGSLATNGALSTGGNASVGAVCSVASILPHTDFTGICGGGSQGWHDVVSYNYVTLSDAALKADLAPLPDVLPLVAAVAPQAFRYGGDDKRHWGFVAQDVRAAISNYPVDIVSGDEGRLGLDYGGLTAMLWKAVQELNQRLIAGGL